MRQNVCLRRSCARNSAYMGGGMPVVLTADRSLMAGYRVLLEGMLASSQTTRTPSFLMKALLAPAVARNGIRAAQAPLGLRRVEAALLAGGWAEEDVIVVRPEELDEAIGPRTRVLGISSGDPLGLGMNSTTVSAILGGEIYTSRWFRALLKRIELLRRRSPGLRLVMGGPGAWQLVQHRAEMRSLGIDHVVIGHSEGNVGEIFRQVANGESVPPVLEGKGVSGDEIPPLRGPTGMGAVEISRGCGLGCEFCALAHQPMRHLPLETILADVETNVRGGNFSIALITEDIFRYRAEACRVNSGAVLTLLNRLRGVKSLRFLQTDHANVNSISEFDDHALAEMSHLFAAINRSKGWTWLNIGVESASGALLEANGCAPKMRPCPPESWGEFCHDQIGRLLRAGFFPMISLMLGLPGETPDDVRKTTQWVSLLAKMHHSRPLAVFPLLYAPIGGTEGQTNSPRLSREHWHLICECYQLNFRWIPRLLWQNQSEAGVGIAKRLLIRLLGQLQICWWKGLLAWRKKIST